MAATGTAPQEAKAAWRSASRRSLKRFAPGVRRAVIEMGAGWNTSIPMLVGTAVRSAPPDVAGQGFLARMDRGFGAAWAHG
ncbi:MAG: hypothetical protein EBS05_21200 [Proteobacteria bacterium]|nr:hypothetical protein [Pseudomonadota bacterium]